MPLQLTLYLELAKGTRIITQLNPTEDRLEVVTIKRGVTFRVLDELRRHADLLGVGPTPEVTREGVGGTPEGLWLQLEHYEMLDSTRQNEVNVLFQPVFSLLSIEYENWGVNGHELIGDMRMYMKDSPLQAWVWKDRVWRTTAAMVTSSPT